MFGYRLLHEMGGMLSLHSGFEVEARRNILDVKLFIGDSVGALFCNGE